MEQQCGIQQKHNTCTENFDIGEYLCSHNIDAPHRSEQDADCHAAHTEKQRAHHHLFCRPYAEQRKEKPVETLLFQIIILDDINHGMQCRDEEQHICKQGKTNMDDKQLIHQSGNFGRPRVLDRCKGMNGKQHESGQYIYEQCNFRITSPVVQETGQYYEYGQCIQTLKCSLDRNPPDAYTDADETCDLQSCRSNCNIKRNLPGLAISEKQIVAQRRKAYKI